MTCLRHSRCGRLTRHLLTLESVDRPRHEDGGLAELAENASLHAGGSGREAWSGPINHSKLGKRDHAPTKDCGIGLPGTHAKMEATPRVWPRHSRLR